MTKALHEENSSVLPITGFWEKLAQTLSVVTNPLYVALPIFLLVALHTAPDLLRGFVWWVVTVVCITVAPLWFIWRGVHRGELSDGHLSIREQRIVPLLFGLVCAGVALVVLLLLQVSASFLATIVAVLVAGVVTLIITRYWTKISLHLIGITGAVTVLLLVFGPLLLVVSPLIVLVGWARWRLRAHTLLQMGISVVLAVGVTVGIFRLFGVI
jgi:hypothetical protein